MHVCDRFSITFYSIVFILAEKSATSACLMKCVLTVLLIEARIAIDVLEGSIFGIYHAIVLVVGKISNRSPLVHG